MRKANRDLREVYRVEDQEPRRLRELRAEPEPEAQATKPTPKLVAAASRGAVPNVGPIAGFVVWVLLMLALVSNPHLLLSLAHAVARALTGEP